jgi:hypothetical protein
MVEEGYFWTRKRWEEHRKGLGESCERGEFEKRKRQAGSGEGGEEVEGYEYLTNDPSWNGIDFLPQGTVGCVVLDSTGTLCVATSTGGITNKLPGRVGDTPTLGAGFWAEEWQSATKIPREIASPNVFQNWTSQHRSPNPAAAPPQSQGQAMATRSFACQLYGPHQLSRASHMAKLLSRPL